MQVLIAQHDSELRQQLSAALRPCGLDVIEAEDGPEALHRAFSARPSVIVVDARIEGMDGLELITVLRAATEVPLLGLTADRAGRYSATRVLDCGADDCIVLPASTDEFAARVRAAVRRYERTRLGAEEHVVRTGALSIDSATREVVLGGMPVRLTRTEFRLLEALGHRVGRVAPHRYLLTTVWGEQYIGDAHYLRVYIGYLRAKIEAAPARPRYILSEWGLGYRLARLPITASTPSDSELAPRPAIGSGAA